MNLVKSQIPRSDYGRDTLILSSVCVATIGVCVFRCADFGWRTFLSIKFVFRRKENGKSKKNVCNCTFGTDTSNLVVSNGCKKPYEL